ncbi:MAG TPA: divalent metal cation transporter [Candidatus Acidoferrales bacterium]|jgi:Mn2+/Fe2+ NRAMP family transporter|nr:divalent metal cation transporter [Candidatus Acidoferrales bacterium]
MDSSKNDSNAAPRIHARPTTESAAASSAAPELATLLTHEDVDRARDRWQVARARRKGRGAQKFRGVRLLWLLIGPGVLVFLGENDAPSMLSYSADGARYGVGFFIPFVVLTFLMGFIVQEMTVRLGAVTHRGHAELIFDRFGKFWGFFAMGDLVLGNFLTLVTEFIGVRAGLGFFGIRPTIAIGGALVIVAGAITTGRYWTWERITMGLAIFNGLFIPAAILARPNWHAVGHALVTWMPLPGGNRSEILLLILATIGATVTPWMLFFQQSAVVDKGMQPRDINAGRLDTMLGVLLASAFAIAAILATAPLFHHGINAADFQAAQFAEALQPLIGHTGAALFALGIFEAGIVAAIAISTSSAYAFGEVLQTGHSLNRPLRDAWPFYLVLLGSACAAAALVLIPQFPLEFVVLTVNVIAVLAMPPALAFLLLLVNDREVMGEYVNGTWANVAGIGVTLLLIFAGIGFGIATVFPKWLGG